MRATCGRKVVDRKVTEDQIDMLGLKERVDRLAKAKWRLMAQKCASKR